MKTRNESLKNEKNELEKDLMNCQSHLKDLEYENRRLEDQKQQDKDLKSLFKKDIQQITLKLRSCEERYNKLINCE